MLFGSSSDRSWLLFDWLLVRRLRFGRLLGCKGFTDEIKSFLLLVLAELLVRILAELSILAEVLVRILLVVVVDEDFTVPVLLTLAVLFFLRPRKAGSKYKDAPPMVTKSTVSSVPLLGPAIEFGKSPVKMVKRCYDDYGPVFTVPVRDNK